MLRVPAPADAAPKFARVEPLTRTRAVRGPFDYLLPDGPDQIEVGSLLRVPFGGRSTLGVVVALAGETELEPHRLARPEAVLPGRLPEELVGLAWWMASEYCSTPARALGLMLPPGAAQGTGHREALVAELTPAGQRALSGQERLTDGQRAALNRLRAEGPGLAAALGTPLLRRLERRGLVSLEHRRQPRRTAHPQVGSASRQPLPLTDEQRVALEAILAALHGGGARFLLHGVTGSGKT